MAPAKVSPAISTILRQRLRREFAPREFAPACRTLAAWDTRVCAPGEARERMLRAVITLALGELTQLHEYIRVAESDFRDVLWWSEYRQHRRLQVVHCDREPGQPNSEEEAFLAAIAKVPTDTLTRLVYADWLDERNDPRGGYLRCLCEWLTSRKLVNEELFAREAALRVGLSKAWLARVRGMPVRYKASGGRKPPVS